MKTTSQSGPITDEALSHVMDGLWARFLPDIRARVSVLEAAAQVAREGKLPAKQREAAQSAAHKLAGVLGTFSLARGTELARELELQFSGTPASASQLASIASELRAVIDSRR